MNAPFESPIEALLVAAISEEVRKCEAECTTATQVNMGPYRVDILVEVYGRKLVVECDGAAHHAATKEQVERDKRRDRYFTANNIPVMRFTGSEINRSARACASEVGAWIEAAASDRKAAIMEEWEQGKISRLEACRRIRRGGLAKA